MSDLFTNLIGRSAGAGPQLRPLHPLYRGEEATSAAQDILSSGAGVEVLEKLIEFTAKASLPQERK